MSFKSFAVSALAAASTLLSVTVSTPALACAFCGGIKLNGIEFNGIEFNGPILQGISIQGPLLQGVSLQGTTPQASVPLRPSRSSDVPHSRPATSIISVTLPSGETVKLR